MDKYKKTGLNKTGFYLKKIKNVYQVAHAPAGVIVASTAPCKSQPGCKSIE